MFTSFIDYVEYEIIGIVNASKNFIHPRPPLREHLWPLVIQVQSVIYASLMIMCASGFSDLCIWRRDHILLPAICASGIIIFLFFFFLVTFLLWKEDLAEKIFLTIGREHLSRFFS